MMSCLLRSGLKRAWAPVLGCLFACLFAHCVCPVFCAWPGCHAVLMEQNDMMFCDNWKLKQMMLHHAPRDSRFLPGINSNDLPASHSVFTSPCPMHYTRRSVHRFKRAYAPTCIHARGCRHTSMNAYMEWHGITLHYMAWHHITSQYYPGLQASQAAN